MPRPQFTLRRMFLMVTYIALGISMLIEGSTPRPYKLWIDAWYWWSAGAGFIGAAIGVPFGYPIVAGLLTLFGFFGFLFAAVAMGVL